MDIILYQQAAQNVAGEPVSIEPNGSVWADADHRDIDGAAIEMEYERLIAERVAARESAVAKLAALGLNESEVAAIVGGV